MNKVCRIFGTNAGFFSMFRGTVSTFLKCEQENVVPHVFWGNTLYNDEQYGINAWEYYFDQIGDFNNAKQKYEIKNHRLMPREYKTRVEMNRLIKKYVSIKKSILQELDEVTKDFSDNTLGVHIRMTDKHNCTSHGEPITGRPINIDLYVKHVENYLLENKNSKIYLATDDEECLKRMTNEFGDSLIYRDVIRSSGEKSIHHHMKGNNYLKGKEVLLDCLSLSKCDHIIKGISNVALCSMFFNLNLTDTNLNSIYNGDKREDFVKASK